MKQESGSPSPIVLGDAVWDDTFSILLEGTDSDGRRLLLRTFKSEEPTPAELQWLNRDEDAHRAAPRGTAHECLERLKIHHKPYLVYRDEGFRPMGRWYLGQLEANLRLARGVTRALKLFHDAGMTHYRLNPTTIWIHPERPDVRLFDLTGGLIRETRPSSSPPPRFPYLAPEQVNPTAFSCDYRTDLFALGIVLYRGLTGRRPFDALDADSHRHELLTEEPLRPDELDPTVPSWVSEIVMRLLSKAPEQRYQTHYGLTYDLTESLLERGGKLGSGETQVGDRDRLAAFRVPDTFRGREQETAIIVEAAQAARSGPLHLVALSGAPGIGKSGLVYSVQQRLRDIGMAVAGAKVDPFSTDIHYGLFVRAIEARLAQMAGREGRLDDLGHRVKEALGVNTSLIADLIPELAAIVGDLPKAPEVPSGERLNRFNATFEKFVGLLIEVGGPLCLFFDDLQWADSGSLALLEYLVAARSLRGLFVLSCFRSTGEGSERAEDSLQRIAASGTPTSVVRLEGLAPSHIAQLIREALGPASDESMCEKLGELVYRRTEGNPLFARQLLEYLHTQGLLFFDGELDRWTWDPDEIVQRAITEDVIDLARAKLDRLGPRTKSALIAGACISNPFEPDRIASLIREPEETTYALLDQAVENGVLTQVGSGYRFIHDKLAQAAYSLVPEDDLAVTRLRFGERLLDGLSVSGSSNVPVDVVNNINFGLSTVKDPKRRLAYAELNLKAGKQARRESAYRDALHYFRAGMDWAPESAWITDHRFMFDLYSETFESEYLNGNVAAANALFESLEAHTKDQHDFAGVVYTKILLLTGENRGAEAVEAGVEALRDLGMRITARPHRAQVLAELLWARAQTRFRSTESLAEATFSGDKTLKATNALLMIIGPAAYFENTDIMAFAGLRLLNRSLSRAHTTESAFGYVIYGLVLSAVTGKHHDGYRFARLAMKLADRGGDIVLRSKIWLISGAFIAFWSQPVKTALEILNESLSQSLEAGDIQYANYSVLGTVSVMFSSGTRLSEVLSLNERYEPLVRRTNDSFSIETHRLWHEAIRTMLGETEATLDPAAEEAAMRQFRATGNQTALTYFWIVKTQLHYLEQDYTTAYEFGMRAQDHADSVLGQIVGADLFLYLGLSAAALAKSRPGQQKQYVKTLSQCKRQFLKWAESCPENFRQQYELLSAELESVRGRSALDAYERTMRLAAKSRFTQVEALANELAAQHLEREGHRELAGVFLERAWRLYREWDANRKARRLATQHAHLRVLSEVAQHQGEDGSARSEGTSAQSATPFWAAASVEEALDALCRGATADGAIVFRGKDDSLQIEAVRAGTPNAETAHGSAVVRYVAKTRSSIAIQDSTKDTRFAQCPHLKKHQPRSVFCTMLSDGNEPIGIVYLENRSLPGIFSEAAVAAIRPHLATIEAALSRTIMVADLHEKQSHLEQTRHMISRLESHRDHLGKFVPVPVRRLLAENPEAPEMVRQEREVSVMFVDIAGYTRMSEALGKEAVERLVSTYFSSFAEEIWQRQGEIVETAGDGFMAVFENPTHESLAAQSAVALQVCVAELNEKHRTEFPKVVINIGINSGPALVGLSRLGGKTDERWAYTVHGPTTNLAARIADRATGGQILISETTVKKLAGEPQARDRGLCEFKGVSRKVRVFEIEVPNSGSAAGYTTTAKEN
jgi:predicted ATPase/class 3 adenylate cyclase